MYQINGNQYGIGDRRADFPVQKNNPMSLISTQYHECEYDHKNVMICQIQLHYIKTVYSFEMEILFEPSYLFEMERNYKLGAICVFKVGDTL